MIVFFDASALIYLVEGKEPFGGQVRKELAQLVGQHPGLSAAESRVTR